MDNSIYDIGIVGGGLAGLTLAIQCADAGYRVVLFEKEQYPFHRVCGEYISFESFNFLQSLGIPVSTMQLPVIKKLEISDIKGRMYSFPLPLGGFGISRYLLDNLLYQTALDKGVNVFTGNKVSGISYNNDQFLIDHAGGTATVTVAAGAFGKRSNIDVKMNRRFIIDKPDKLNNYIGVKYHVKYHQPADTIALHNFDQGYCGISKIEDDQYCLCYLTTAHHLKQSGNSIQTMQEKVLFQNPQLKKIFTTATFVQQQPVTISQISFHKKQQVEQHLLMIGDTAGMIPPLCGNGMSMAMHASKIAFGCIRQLMDGHITRNQMELLYEREWKRQFEKRLWVGRTVQRMFGSTSSILFLKTMKVLPFVASQVIRQTHGTPF